MISKFFKKLKFSGWGDSRHNPKSGRYDWSTNGDGAGEYAGFETPAKLKDTGDQWGQNYGAARVPEGKALKKNGGPFAWIHGAVKKRKGILKEEGLRAALVAGKRAKTAEPRKQGAKEKVRVVGQRKMFLQSLLPGAEAKAQQFRTEVETRVKVFLDMPRSHRGFFDSVLVVGFVGTGVVLFDCWVLHGVLETSGMSPTTVWGTSVTVPLAIAAVNHAFGITAGAIAGKASDTGKLRLTMAIFFAGVGACLIAFVLLTIFRVQAADSQNAAIAALANGDASAQLTFFVSPIWMGPLQVAGSFAAIAVGALWAVAKEGRDYKTLVIAPVARDLKNAELELVEINNGIKGAQMELETASLEEYEIEADKQAAMVEVEAEERITEAKLEGEDGLEVAVQGEFEAAYTYFDKIGENGGVWRAARPTEFPLFGRPYTPGASDKEGAPNPDRDPRPNPNSSEPSTNGTEPKQTRK